VQFRFY